MLKVVSTLSLVILPILGLGAAEGKFKVIGDFENESDLARWKPVNCTTEQVKENATSGEYSLKIDFFGSATDTWPAIEWRPTGEDMNWSNVTIIEVDACKPETPGVPLYACIVDKNGKKEIMTNYISPGKPSTYRYIIKGKDLDMSSIAKVQLYRSCPREDYTIFVDNIRLRLKGE